MFNDFFKNLVAKYLGSIVRHGLTLLAGVLITYGLIKDDGASFVNANYDIIMGLITYIGVQIMSFAEKKATTEKIEAVKEVAKEAIKK